MKHRFPRHVSLGRRAHILIALATLASQIQSPLNLVVIGILLAKVPSPSPPVTTSLSSWMNGSRRKRFSNSEDICVCVYSSYRLRYMNGEVRKANRTLLQQSGCRCASINSWAFLEEEGKKNVVAGVVVGVGGTEETAFLLPQRYPNSSFKNWCECVRGLDCFQGLQRAMSCCFWNTWLSTNPEPRDTHSLSLRPLFAHR